jgi:hypothetical protein
MSEGTRFFTVEEANDLVAALEIEFGRVARVRAELGPLVESLGPEVAMGILQQGDEGPPGREADAVRLRALAAEITGALERVNDLGCLVKDLDMGLVDFHAMVGGAQVFLCWQYGEPAVAHWHGLEEGYANRRPIEGVSVIPPEFMN